jgi:hypothetical protein
MTGASDTAELIYFTTERARPLWLNPVPPILPAHPIKHSPYPALQFRRHKQPHDGVEFNLYLASGRRPGNVNNFDQTAAHLLVFHSITMRFEFQSVGVLPQRYQRMKRNNVVLYISKLRSAWERELDSLS